MLDETQKDLAENQINESSKNYDYYTVEWDLRSIHKRYSEGLDLDDNELFVPTYQRNFTWTKKLQSKFIESLLLNLPIPYIFLNETGEYDENKIFQRLEIVDGSQRIRTIVSFMNNEFKLSDLTYLTGLEGFKYEDMLFGRQKKFDRIPLRILIFKGLDKEQKKEMFNRINTTSDLLKAMEVRKGSFAGEFYEIIKELSDLPIFNELCPLTEKKLRREENVELVLRFFAYTEKFEQYNEKVQKFLDSYMSEKTEYFDTLFLNDKEKFIKEKEDFKEKFTKMLEAVKLIFPDGFRKKGGKTAASRTYYESIAVGTGLALNNKNANDLNNKRINELLLSKEFNEIVSSDGSNYKVKFFARINIIKDHLLLN